MGEQGYLYSSLLSLFKSKEIVEEDYNSIGYGISPKKAKSDWGDLGG